MKKVLVLLGLAGSSWLFSACTWVALTHTGETVSVVKPQHVRACRSLGSVTSEVASEVAGAKRSPAKVSKELESLARNNAVEMRGDTLVEGSPIKHEKQKFKTIAKQSFKVYRCR